MLSLWARVDPKSNGNEGLLCIPRSSRITGALAIRLFSVVFKTLIGGALPLSRDAVDVFYRIHSKKRINNDDINDNDNNTMLN